jgi:hypothetical protein
VVFDSAPKKTQALVDRAVAAENVGNMTHRPAITKTTEAFCSHGGWCEASEGKTGRLGQWMRRHEQPAPAHHPILGQAGLEGHFVAAGIHLREQIAG